MVVDGPCNLVLVVPLPKGLVMPETQDVALYDANKGLLKRSGGPYLDEMEAKHAEEIRAGKEGREPDLETPPAYVGTVLVPKSYLRETDNDHSAAALGGYVELEHDPVETLTVDVTDDFTRDPDPRQVNWDNDSQKVAAMQAEAAYSQAKADAKVEDAPTPVAEPVDPFAELNKDSKPNE